MPSKLDQQLIEAAKRGDFGEVRRLVEQGADVNFDDIPSFLWAYFSGHKEIAKFLLSQGGNVNHDQFEEGTILTFAALGGDVEFLEYLLKAGAAVDHAMPKGGQTALFHAVNQNQLAAAKALIEHGADVNHPTKEHGTSSMDHFSTFCGERPLHMAAVCGDKDMIEILLSAGADRTTKTTRGETALDYAKKQDRSADVIRLLEQVK